jgi:GT2 family glycosyltransferase
MAERLDGLLARWSTKVADRNRIDRIVVVNNDEGDSVDPSAWPPNLPTRYIKLGGNRGYAAGVNAGWRALDTDYVLLLNPAAEIGTDSIERMADLLDVHPEVGALAPMHADHDGRPINRYHTLPSWLDLACHGTHLYRFAWAKRRVRAYQCDWLDDITPDWPLTPVEQPPASCLLIRREAVEGEPMDEAFPILFNDVDLSTRLRRNGWRTLIVPDVVCRHLPATATRYLGVRARAEGYLGAFRYLRKWYGVLPSNAYRVLLSVSLALSARHRSLRRENREAVAALLRNRSIFDRRDVADPVHRFWPR